MSNVEIDNFEKEDNNLINKLNNLNVNNDEIEINDNFEEKETLNEYDSINYIKKMVKLNMYQNS